MMSAFNCAAPAGTWSGPLVLSLHAANATTVAIVAATGIPRKRIVI
jgi:hypothetical protein